MPATKFTFDQAHMDAAYQQAIADADGSPPGIPIGAALFYDDGQHQELFVGRNRRVQDNSAIRHGETDCLEQAESRPAAWYQHTTLFTTLFPCTMCSGAIALFGIPRVVIGEAKNFPSNDHFKKGLAFLELHGVEYQILDDQRCIDTLAKFIRDYPEIWNADVPYQVR